MNTEVKKIMVSVLPRDIVSVVAEYLDYRQYWVRNSMNRALASIKTIPIVKVMLHDHLIRLDTDWYDIDNLTRHINLQLDHRLIPSKNAHYFLLMLWQFKQVHSIEANLEEFHWYVLNL